MVTIDGRRVQALRTAAGLDRDRFAALAGASRHTIARIERLGPVAVLPVTAQCLERALARLHGRRVDLGVDAAAQGDA
jgi:DNA-binding XRE family transcriptional regulator